MAIYYKVGGTGNWSSSAMWSLTSGGAGGAGVPTLADDVILNSASNATAYTLTVDVASACNNLTIAGPTSGNVTFAGTLGLSVYGNISVAATGVTWTYSGAFVHAGTGTATILSGVSMTCPFTKSGTGSLTLASAVTFTGVFTHTAGAFDTSASNFNFTASNYLCTGALVRSYNWRASTITVTGQVTITFSGTNLTATPGTSTFVISTNNNINLNAPAATFWNIRYTSTALSSSAIQGNLTCQNLTYGTRSSAGMGFVTISSGVTITVNGTLSNVALNSACRLFFKSATIGTAVTISAGTVSLTDCDFRNVIATGTATWTGTRLGDCGGNTGITFDTAKTVYFSFATGGNVTATCWALTSGGTPGVNNFPLPQDTAIINDASSNASTTITLNQITAGYNFSAFDSSARTTALTISYAGGTANYYGSQIHSSSVTITGTNYLRFCNRGTTATITFPNGLLGGIIVDNVNGTVTLGSNVTYGTTYNLDHTSGNLNLNGYTLTAATYLNSGTLSRTLIGPGTIKLIGVTGNVWSSASNLVYTNNTSINVVFTGAIASAATLTVAHQGASTAAAINFAFQGGLSGSNISIRATGYYRDLDFTGTNSTIANLAFFVSGSVNLGTTATFTAGTNAWTLNPVSGTNTFTSNTKTVDWPITVNGVGGTITQADAFTLGATRTFTLLRGTWSDGGFESFLPTVSSTGALVRSMTINGTCTNAISWTASGSNATFSGSGTLSMTNASAKTFAGGGFTYPFTLNQGGAGALTITGANTFGNITNTVIPCTISLPPNVTTTVSSLGIAGSLASGQVTLNSSTVGTKATLSDASGIVNLLYCTIKDIGATGGATFQALLTNGNIDSGNNSGWIFILSSGNFLMFFV